MDKVNIETKKLLAKVKANREQHKKEYEEAILGFRKQVIEKLTENLTLAQAGEPIELFLRLTEPRSYLDSYDQIITMLEMTTDKIIELTNNDFASYVMDNWEWKQSFTSTMSLYNSKRK